MKRFIILLIMLLVSVTNADWYGEHDIDEYLTFAVTTSQFSTGAGFNAASVPIYYIYEDITAAAVVSGSMGQIDGAGEIGLYVERVQLTDANFDAGKMYTIFIEATVDSVDKTFFHAFKMRAAPLALASAQLTAQEVEDTVWDAALTGASHNDGNSAGKRLRQVEHTTVLREEEQAQGGTASTITLHDDASSITGFYDDTQVVIVGDTGIGQSRHIHAYVGNTRVATITPDWITTPNATSDYVLMADSEKHVHEIDDDVITAGVIADGAITDAKVANDVKVDTVTVVGITPITIEDIDNEIWNKDISGISDADLAGSILNDVPTTSEFNARTLAAAAYFLFGSDTVSNVGTVAALSGHTAQSGDSFTRLGAPNGASIAADIAVIQALWDSLTITGGLLEIDMKKLNGITVKSTNGNIHALPGNI